MESEADYSSRPFAWWLSSNQSLSYWRTWQRSFLEDWTEFAGRWPRSGVMRNGIAYRLPTLAPRISGIGSSYWPTPNAQERGGKQTPGSQLSLTKCVLGWKKDATKREYIPTPKATDGSKGSRTLEGAINEVKRGKNLDLGVVVRMLPTPTARDWKSGKGWRANGHTPQLPEVTGGQLNPQWVEWLMGFPEGWTDLRG